MARDIAMEKKREFFIQRSITVDDITSELVVKVSVDMQKGTFKVIGTITTKNVSMNSPELTEATLTQYGEMMLEGVIKAQEVRRDVLEGAQNETADLFSSNGN